VETAETKELARNAVECMVATMFDVPLEEIERFYFEPVEPDGVRVILHLEKNQRLEHIARNPDARACAVEVGGIARDA
jgi:hypothetical protein